MDLDQPQIANLFQNLFKVLKQFSFSGSMIIAFVLCVTDSGKEKKVWKRVAAMDHVKEAYIVYGEADVVIKLVTKNLEELDPIVTRIGETKGVYTTSTLIAIDSNGDETRIYDEKTRIY